jgi:hypothetical protein
MATWPIKKDVRVGEQMVQTTSTKRVLADHSVVIEVAATVAGITYVENMTLPKENPQYSAQQCQKDFDAHLLKVAQGALGRHTSHSVSDSLQ